MPAPTSAVNKSSSEQTVDSIARAGVAVRLRLLNRVVTNLFDDARRPLGLKASRWNFRIASAKLGLARPARVCNILHLGPANLSRNLERMRPRGWLEVVTDQDGRAQPFRLAPRRKRGIERAMPAGEAGQRKACELLGSEGIAVIERVSRKLGGPGRGHR